MEMIGGLLVLLIYLPIILFIFNKGFRKRFNKEHADSKILLFIEILNGILYFLMIYVSFNKNFEFNYLSYFGILIYFPSLLLVYRGYILYFEKKNLIKDFPFNISRNPTYFFGYLAVLGVGLMINSYQLILIILLQAFFVHFVILKEEEYLERRFGKEYFEYKKKVRRYI